MDIKPFQAVYPNVDFITSAEHFFSTVKEKYNEYDASGFFNKAAQEGLYIHQIQVDNRIYTGLICCVSIQNYLDGKIKKHENTLASKEQQQIHLLLQRKAHVKPILLTYHGVPEIDNFIKKFIKKKKPFQSVKFDESDQLHSFWEITDGKLIQQLQLIFKNKIPHSYIADGHHRSSTTAIMHQRNSDKSDLDYDVLLCALYPSSELEILDFNRVIEGLNELSPTIFMARISQIFEVELLESAQKPTRKHELTMLLDKEWYRLTLRAKIIEEYQHLPTVLDVTILNQKVLQSILNIQDVRTDARVKYVEGPKGLETVKGKTAKNEHRVAFCLYPVSMHDFLAISDAGKILPPKSTWFEPRMINGLIVKEL